MKGKKKRGRPRKTWKLQVEKESKSVGLKKEDAMNRARWRVGVGEIAARVGYIWPPPFTGINSDQNWNWIKRNLSNLTKKNDNFWLEMTESWAKHQNAEPLIYISLNKNSITFYKLNKAFQLRPKRPCSGCEAYNTLLSGIEIEIVIERNEPDTDNSYLFILLSTVRLDTISSSAMTGTLKPFSKKNDVS